MSWCILELKGCFPSIGNSAQSRRTSITQSVESRDDGQEEILARHVRRKEEEERESIQVYYKDC